MGQRAGRVLSAVESATFILLGSKRCQRVKLLKEALLCALSRRSEIRKISNLSLERSNSRRLSGYVQTTPVGTRVSACGVLHTLREASACCSFY